MDYKELYAKTPVPKAVISLVIPTVISQLITVVYNMADTYFVGQLGDPVQVAAATIAMPPFIFLTGIANLFGIGGASLISRCMGVKDLERAHHGSAFSFWMAGIVAFLYGLLFMIARPVILPLMGVTEETYVYTYEYVVFTVTLGAIPTVLNTILAHFIRTEGKAKQASYGLMFGGILNMILDPVFIFGFDLKIKGAAIATLVSNIIALMYFLFIIYKGRKQTVLSLKPKDISFSKGIPAEILLVGLPSFIMTFMSFFSNTTLNRLMSNFSSTAIAGMGIAKKADMVGFALAQGMTQGVLALIGYNYATGDHKRMGDVIKTTTIYSGSLAAICSVGLYIFATPVAKLFIQEPETIVYGARFIRTLCLTLPASSVTMMIITVFQATGEKRRPMFLSLLRKGGLDVPFMFLFFYTVGLFGIPWATPIADILTMTCSALLFYPYWKKLVKH